MPSKWHFDPEGVEWIGFPAHRFTIHFNQEGIRDGATPITFRSALVQTNTLTGLVQTGTLTALIQTVV